MLSLAGGNIDVEEGLDHRLGQDVKMESLEAALESLPGLTTINETLGLSHGDVYMEHGDMETCDGSYTGLILPNYVEVARIAEFNIGRDIHRR